MVNDLDIAALHQRVADEVATAKLHVLACEAQIALHTRQLAEAQDILAETRHRLATSYALLDRAGKAPRLLDDE